MGPAGTTEDGARARWRSQTQTFGRSDVARLIAIAVFAITTLVAVAADWDSPIRVALTIAFLLFGPGLALVELLAIRDPVQRLALATAASLALETLVAAVLFYMQRFSAVTACAVIVALTCAALLAAAWRRGSGAAGFAAEDARGSVT